MAEFKLGHSEEVEDISKSAAFFSDIRDMLHVEAMKVGVDEEKANTIAAKTTIQLVKAYAHNIVYIPQKPLRMLRQLEIYNDVRSEIPIAEIANKHNVSQQWVYQVYKDMRKKHVKRVQRDLF